MIGKTAQILVFDDDKSFAQQLKTMIEKVLVPPVQVQLAHMRDKVEEAFAARIHEFDLFITDIMDDAAKQPIGLEFAQRMQHRLPVVVISGHDSSVFRAATPGVYPIAFVQKGPKMKDLLLPEIRVGLMLKEAETRMSAAELEVRHLGLSRMRGTVAAVRFLLPPLRVNQVPLVTDHLWQLAPIAVGVRDVEECARRRGGWVDHVFGTTAVLLFQGNDALARTLESLRDTWQVLGNRNLDGFYNKPFGAAIVSGMLTTGMFGERMTGISAVVGRLAESAILLAPRAEAGQAITIREWLPAADVDVWRQPPGPIDEETSALLPVSGETVTLSRKLLT